jgi:hypothetical protein
VHWNRLPSPVVKFALINSKIQCKEIRFNGHVTVLRYHFTSSVHFLCPQATYNWYNVFWWNSLFCANRLSRMERKETNMEKNTTINVCNNLDMVCTYRIINLYNQLNMHQNIYTSDVSKSPKCVGISLVPPLSS